MGDHPLLTKSRLVNCKIFHERSMGGTWEGRNYGPWSPKRSKSIIGPPKKHRARGAPKGRARGPPPPPWDLKNTIFSGFLPLNYVIYIFEVCFLCFLLCGRTEEACGMVNSLRKVDCSHPTGHYTRKKNFPPPPLEKILGAPLQTWKMNDLFMETRVKKRQKFIIM